MRKAAILAGLVMLTLAAPIQARTGWDKFSFTVVPFEFDPHGTHLVAAQWKGGIGCPLNAYTAPFLPPDFSTVGSDRYTDPACITGDPWDKKVHGLLLVKTGPTNNNASAGATLNGVYGIKLTELGYDLRKEGSIFSPFGSHCGAGAPRFNVTTMDNVLHFVGCSSPPPFQEATGNGWIRLRWTTVELLAAFPPILPTDMVKSISILFDEAQDAASGPDQFGLAVLDNIDVNGVLVGKGPNKPEDDDCDEGHGKDNHNRHFKFQNSSSRPEKSSMSYEDRSQGVKVQTVSGARAITYTGTCVSFVSDALMNDAPGHVVSFAACDLSALSTPLTPKIGSYTILVTGASGVVYQKTGTLDGRSGQHPSAVDTFIEKGPAHAGPFSNPSRSVNRVSGRCGGGLARRASLRSPA